MKTTKQLVKFDFDLAVITALDAKYKDIQITDGKSYALVMAGLAEYRELRLAIDDKHKELKSDILEVGRGLDGDKNRLKALLEPGEDHLKEIRQIEDDRKAAVKEEKDRKERERIEAIQEKINSIRAQGIVNHSIPSSTIKERLIILTATKLPEDVEFTGQAIQAQKTTIATLEQALTERLQTEKEDAERKAEAERLEKIRKEQEEAQAKIDEGGRKVREGIAKLEADRIAAEKTKEREEFERQAKDKAEAAAAQKLKDAASAEEERAKTAAAEKARKAEMAPDKEKLIKFADDLYNTEIPLVKTTKAQKVLAEARGRLSELAADIKMQAKKL